jgi:NADH-quinone oxidoreductase subunit L
VTAGVYMVARCSVLYALAPATMQIVAIVGLSTAFFAATMGIVQNDIKKVLAYSTISQLGYMFLGLGVGAFASGIFHVMTHAFFKALLFLGAGAVIHAMHDEQDIQRMGGLQSKMPATSKTFFIAALAIAGIPPLSGFFSKDEILWKAFSNGSIMFWIVGWLTAGITAFYMFRLFFLTFSGQSRWSHDKHPHEASKTMTVPLIILAVLSIIGGVVGIPLALGGGNSIEHWLDPVFEPANAHLIQHQHGSVGIEYSFMLLSVLIAVTGIYFARMIYLKQPDLMTKLQTTFRGIHKLLWNKYYVDEIYEYGVVQPIKIGSEKLLWKWFDVGIVDGIVNGTASIINRISGWTRRIQDGVVQNYAMIFVFGIIVLLGILILK